MATSTDNPNLPQDYYCGFDVRQTPDGGKEYALPEAAVEMASTSPPLPGFASR